MRSVYAGDGERGVFGGGGGLLGWIGYLRCECRYKGKFEFGKKDSPRQCHLTSLLAVHLKTVPAH